MSAEARTVFGSYVREASGPRDWAASFLASSAIYVALAVAVVALGSAAKKVVRQAAVEVKFVERIVNEPPPAPPPVVETKPQAPAAAAPVVRPEQKIRRLEKPPPPKEMVAPKEMPKQAPEEAQPSIASASSPAEVAVVHPKVGIERHRVTVLYSVV